MTLPSSGQISLANLRTEYTNLGSQASVKMSDFYYGSRYLRRNRCTDRARTDTSHPGYTIHFQGIPVVSSPVGSELIRLSQFYGKVYYYARQSNVLVNGTNASVNTAGIENEAIKTNTNNSAFFDVLTTGDCFASSTSNFGLSIAQNNRSHTTCYLINDFRVYGRGGRGGNGGVQAGTESGQGGENGGTALSLATLTYLVNNNRILGGGGGGGGGAARRDSYNECYCCNVTNASIAGSGGGGGKGSGAGGSAGSALAANFRYPGGNGSAGDTANTGAGGSGGSSCSFNVVIGTYCSNSGGNGGTWGTVGNSSASGEPGGSGGAAIRRRDAAYYSVITSGTTAGGTVTF